MKTIKDIEMLLHPRLLARAKPCKKCGLLPRFSLDFPQEMHREFVCSPNIMELWLTCEEGHSLSEEHDFVSVTVKRLDSIEAAVIKLVLEWNKLCGQSSNTIVKNREEEEGEAESLCLDCYAEVDVFSRQCGVCLKCGAQL